MTAPRWNTATVRQDYYEEMQSFPLNTTPHDIALNPGEEITPEQALNAILFSANMRPTGLRISCR